MAATESRHRNTEFGFTKCFSHDQTGAAKTHFSKMVGDVHFYEECFKLSLEACEFVGAACVRESD